MNKKNRKSKKKEWKELLLWLLVLLLIAGAVFGLYFFLSRGDDKEPSNELNYDYDLSQYIRLGPYTSLSARFEDTESVDDKTLEEAVFQLRLTYADFVDQTDTVEKNCRVTVTLSLYEDGALLEEYPEEGYTFIVGLESNAAIDGALDRVIEGAALGDTVRSAYQFPESVTEYGSFAGRAILAEAKITAIHKPRIPELDDEIAAQISGDETVTAETFYDWVEARLLETREQLKQTAVWEAFLASCEVLQYPETELQVYIRKLRSQNEQMAELYGVSYDEYLRVFLQMSAADAEEEYLEKAQEQVKIDMACIAVADALGIVLSEEEYQAELVQYYEEENESYGFSSPEEFEAVRTRELIERSIRFDRAFLIMLEGAVPLP